MGTKKEQAYYIAPLQPPTLASVKTWGSSEGAGRIGLALRLNKNSRDSQHSRSMTLRFVLRVPQKLKLFGDPVDSDCKSTAFF